MEGRGKERKAAAKRKRADTDSDLQGPAVQGSSYQQNEPARKEIRYEKRYNDGGAYTFWGPPFTETGEDMNGPDYKMFYFDETTSQMLPVPRGFSADLVGPSENEDVFS